MASLKSYNSFKLDHSAKAIHIIDSIATLRQAIVDFPNYVLLGGGSNVLLTQDLAKDVLVMNIKGISIEQEDNQHVIVNVGAGEEWQDVVMWAIDQDYGGLENLSLIPGKCGAAPMQNIGAYGAELSDVLVSVQCMMKANGALLNMSKADCQLGYRESIFKNEYKGEYIITSIKLRLTKPLFHQIKIDYGDIKALLKEKEISFPTIRDVSNVVMEIRRSKLPNPEHLPNAGSFFKNPIIPIAKYDELKWRFPMLPSYPVSNELCKIPAGWLIDQCGWKGIMIGQVGVHTRQALVLVNHGTASGLNIAEVAKLIQKSVAKKYGITLETEVNYIG